VSERWFALSAALRAVRYRSSTAAPVENVEPNIWPAPRHRRDRADASARPPTTRWPLRTGLWKRTEQEPPAGRDRRRPMDTGR